MAFTIIVGALCALMVIGMPIAFAFLAVNIFVVDGDPDYYHFRPDQNPSRATTSPEDRAYFDERNRELNERMDRCEKAYQTFRTTVKAHLYQ